MFTATLKAVPGEQLSHKRERCSSEILQEDFVTCLAWHLLGLIPSCKTVLVATSRGQIQPGVSEASGQPLLALSSVHDTACTLERFLCTLRSNY